MSNFDPTRELAAEAIAVRIRWFGVIMGYVFVNFLGRETNQPVLNAILLFGAIYTLVDTLFSWNGRIILERWPLVISLMEAIFIGLLCYFDTGLESPFRFYYVLSLLVCSMRHHRAITLTTFMLHAVSFAGLFLLRTTIDQASGTDTGSDDAFADLFLTLTIMGWVTWASTALGSLIGQVSERLRKANTSLTENQQHLEDRIARRTSQLQESQALLVQQEKQAAFGLLAAGIAHEVGNPLAAISSLVQMLHRRDQDEYTSERLQMVNDQLLRIQRTLHELVDFSRPVHNERTRCHVRGIIEEALNIAKYYKGKKGKQIETSFADNLPLLFVVRDQVVQVFLNLILNAMDATPEGGKIEIAADHCEASLIVTVSDNGSGIPEDKRGSLFDPYFTTKETGTGLGLFVCRKIVEGLGGVIRLVYPTELEWNGERTTFEVRLPVEKIETADQESETTTLKEEALNS